MASTMKRPRLEAVKVKSDKTLVLRFVDKRSFLLNMAEDIARYPGLAPLQDAKVFAGALLGDAGWSVEWPSVDIQIGADTLLLDAMAQSANDEDTRVFMQWRAKTGLLLADAAAALGVAPRTISRYASGKEKVPHTLALACLGLPEWQKRFSQSAPN